MKAFDNILSALLNQFLSLCEVVTLRFKSLIGCASSESLVSDIFHGMVDRGIFYLGSFLVGSFH